MANESLNDITLNTSVATLKKKLETENCRFQTRYKKMGGALHAALALKHTNIILLEGEVLSSVNTCNIETTATSSTLSHSFTGSIFPEEGNSMITTTARTPPLSETVLPKVLPISISMATTSSRQVRVIPNPLTSTNV